MRPKPLMPMVGARQHSFFGFASHGDCATGGFASHGDFAGFASHGDGALPHGDDGALPHGDWPDGFLSSDGGFFVKIVMTHILFCRWLRETGNRRIAWVERFILGIFVRVHEFLLLNRCRSRRLANNCRRPVCSFVCLMFTGGYVDSSFSVRPGSCLSLKLLKAFDT